MNYFRLFVRITSVLTVITLIAMPAKSQTNSTACSFDPQTLQFRGNAVEQARCLLRPVRIGGVLGKAHSRLPRPLEDLIGSRVKVKREHLARYLETQQIDATDIGGDLNLRLATAKLPSGAEAQSVYFVIHDTSSPYLGDAPFPVDFDTDGIWRGNDLKIWVKQPVAHVFVNRLGRSITTTPFSEPVAKGWGTKFARNALGDDAKALQLHIELVQPRRRDPISGGPRNDRIAPVPGFTAPQYDRLALLYVAASVRRGTWMIPAFHAAVDDGIPDAHDDPQNFELESFALAIGNLLRNLK